MVAQADSSASRKLLERTLHRAGPMPRQHVSQARVYVSASVCLCTCDHKAVSVVAVW